MTPRTFRPALARRRVERAEVGLGPEADDLARGVLLDARAADDVAVAEADLLARRQSLPALRGDLGEVVALDPACAARLRAA
jgi:hypothetical protein